MPCVDSIGSCRPTPIAGDTATQQSTMADDALLPGPLDTMMLSSDAIDQIAAMLARSSRKDRKESRALGRAEEQSMARETSERVRALREKAHANLKAGIMSGATQVAGGGLRIGSAITVGEEAPAGNPADEPLARSQTNGASSEAKAADAPGGGASRVDIDTPKALIGSADAVEGIGKIGSTVYASEAENLDAEAVIHESRARMAERRADTYVDDQRDATEMLSKVADFLREARNARESSAKAAIMRA